MTRTEWSLALLAAANIVAAFGSQLVVFILIGPGADTDALFAAAALPTIVNTVIAVALPAALVPRLAAEARQWQAEVSAAMSIALLAVMGTLAIALIAISDWWVELLFAGFTPAQAELCARLQRIQLVAMVPTAATALMTSLLAARARFVGVEALTLSAAVLALAGMAVLLPPFGVEAAAWLTLGRAVLLLALLFPLLEWPARVRPAWSELRALWHSLRPLIGGNVYYKTELLVDRALLSMGAAGELSLYGTAQQAHTAAGSVTGKVWGSVAITTLAAHAKAGNRAAFISLFRRNLAFLIALPAAGCVALFAVGQPLLDLVIGYGRLSSGDVHLLWWLMVLLSGVFVGGSAGTLLVGAFYALGDTRTPTYMSIVTFSVFLFVKYFAFRWRGVEGLCYAATAYYLLNAMLLSLLLPRVMARRLPA